MTAIVVARRAPVRRRLLVALAVACTVAVLVWAVLRSGASLLVAGPVRIPIVVVIPWWVWTAVVLLGAGYIGWLIYRDQAVLEQLDKATDDSDAAVRGVQRHDDELRQLRDQLEQLSTRPTPFRRTMPEPSYGRHAAQ